MEVPSKHEFCSCEGNVQVEGTQTVENDVVEVKEALNAQTSSESIPKVVAEAIASMSASETVTLNGLKEPAVANGISSKNNKIPQNRPNSKGKAPVPYNKRPNLSQSFSIPTRGAHADGIKKSIEDYPQKTNTKQNGSTSASQLDHSGRIASTGANSTNEASAKSSGASDRRTSLASRLSTQQSLSWQSSSVDATASCAPLKASESFDQISNPVKSALITKEDDDGSHSINLGATLRGQRRISTGAGFAFRSTERAEKRKEFYSKLEEKIHAKDVERSNLQEKSKASQEAELKQLRKSLTFKATPIPSFYKEPPPKVELKKIPTTRAKSPKLGRLKNSMLASHNSLEGSGSALSSCLALNQEPGISTKRLPAKSDKDAAAKKSIQKSRPNIQSQVTVTTKSKGEPANFKPKTANIQSQNPPTEDHGDSNKDDVDLHKNEDNLNADSEKCPDPVDGPIPPNPDPVPEDELGG